MRNLSAWLAAALVFMLGLVVAGSAQAGIDRWTTNGPYGGSVFFLALSPDYATDHTAFASTDDGVFKTTDGGASWTAANMGIANSYIYGIFVSPNYAADKTIFTNTNHGIFKTTDGGASWTAVNTGLPYSNASVLAISPNYASDHMVFATDGNHLFKTTDDGASWNEMNPGLTSTGIFSLAVSPNYTTDKTVFAGTYDGVFKTTDGGASWTKVRTASGDNLILAISPNYTTDNTVFATIMNGIVKTTDGGASWTAADTGLNGTHILYLAVSPTYATDHAAFALTNNGSLFKTTDGGASWTDVSTGLPYGDASALAISPNYATDNTVFAGTFFEGAFRTTDGGASWTHVSTGLTSIHVVALAMSPNYASDHTAFTVTSGDNMFKTTDGGASWTAANTGLTSTWIFSLAVSPNYAMDKTVFAGTDAGMFKTTDGGASWTAADMGITNSYVYAVFMSPNYAADNTIFANTDNTIYKTTDGGTSWAAVKSEAGVLAISPNYASDQTLFSWTYYGVSKTTDGGTSWADVNTWLPYRDIFALVFSPNYATDHTVFAWRESDGIFKTTDDGASWTAVNTGLTNTRISSLALSPNYALDNTAFAAGANVGGVFKTTTGGASWAAVNTGLGNIYIMALAVSPNYAMDHTVFAGTDGGGAWSYTFSDTTPPTASVSPTSQTTNTQTTASATATDSDSPALTYLWTKQAGPGTITFGTPSALSTTISADTDGTYTIRFIAADAAGNSAYSDMTLAWDTTTPSSSITAPRNAAILAGAVITITGTATDGTGGSGVAYVDVSTDGGRTWHRASGTGNWSYAWSFPPSGGSRTIKSRATDFADNVETSGPGITVTLPSNNNYGSPELPHYNWDASMIPGGTDCTACHAAPGAFQQPGPFGIGNGPGFCYSCHNAAGNGHSLGVESKHSQYCMLGNATSAGRRRPVYGNITAGERNDIPANRLVDGYVKCATCHNSMRKSDDPGRVWELTSTGDRITYRLLNGGWSAYGNLTPKVYRDTTLWGSGGPSYSKAKKGYIVDPSEYAYNELSGFIRFKARQDSSSYIYVTLYYPYLRASMQDNALCSDCHTEATHKEANCLNCHQSHNTSNIKGIREKVRTLDYTTIPVKFLRYTGVNSFTDGDSTHDGICEVCHATTKYYRRDGSGLANHTSTGLNYAGKNCAACHSHATGFAR